MPTHVVEFDVQRVQEGREQACLRGPTVSASALREPVDRTGVAAVRIAARAGGGLVGRDAGPALQSWHEVFGGRENERSETTTAPQASSALPVDGEGESGGAVHPSIVTDPPADGQCSAALPRSAAVAARRGVIAGGDDVVRVMCFS